MLNNDALSQLTQLKKDIQASKEYGTGTVVGSNGRFGFVKLEDGRDAFLSPEKMQRLIPGDSVKVSLKRNDKDKLEADLEKLLSPGLDRFIGQYRIKGKTHFVQPSGAQSSRWIFLPPKMRGKHQEGDYVIAKLLTHPFRDGKPSAKILENLGQAEGSLFEHKFIQAKYDLVPRENPANNKQASAITKSFESGDFGERKDLCAIPFVTIDASTTLDMDDAIALEALDNDQVRLHVAIADPSNFISQDSALAKQALKQAQSVYLPGGTIPMLPEQLGHYCFSLEANKKRPALVCHMDFDSEGSLLNSEFEFALVESKHKLDYDSVAAFLGGDESAIPADTQEMLKALEKFANARRSFRERNSIVSQDQFDYDYSLNERGHIESIAIRQRNAAHQIVEEAMLATNISGAQLLAKYNIGLAASHAGFREDRIGEVNALLKEEEINSEEINTLDGHIGLFRTLDANEDKRLLIAPLRRMMESVVLSPEFKPHLGMGLPVYATITSPIRRYADLCNHWALQQILCDKQYNALNESQLEQLQENIQTGKQADRELFQWLIGIYTKQLVGQQAKGKVRIVTQHGFGVKLDDSGVEGFVLLPKDKEKKYDAKRMTIEVNETKYYMGMDVEIKIKGVDLDKRRIAFEIPA